MSSVELVDLAKRYGDRVLFEQLTMSIEPGEFIAILGPNGAGKSTLLKILLGIEPPSAGRALVDGSEPKRGSNRIGYVPQLRAIDRDIALRGVDLVRLGLDGHRYGLSLRSRDARTKVADAIASVGATSYATRPVGRLSGGEQQRLRIAQAMLTDPSLLLCDEPLLGLDFAHQRGVVELLDERRKEHGTTVLFVTHEINPVLPFVDRVAYFAAGRVAVGPPSEVLTTERLSSLYGDPVDVIHVRGRLLIVGGDDSGALDVAGHHHVDHDDDAGFHEAH